MKLDDYPDEALIEALADRIRVDADEDRLKALLVQLVTVARQARRAALRLEPEDRSKPYDGKTVELPLTVAFRALEALRLVTVYLDPPEDFKPWKFPTAEEYAPEVAAAFRELLAAMSEDMGMQPSDAAAQRAGS